MHKAARQGLQDLGYMDRQFPHISRSHHEVITLQQESSDIGYRVRRVNNDVVDEARKAPEGQEMGPVYFPLIGGSGPVHRYDTAGEAG